MKDTALYNIIIDNNEITQVRTLAPLRPHQITNLQIEYQMKLNLRSYPKVERVYGR